MNIIEAVKSGRKFMRPCWDNGSYADPNHETIDGLSIEDLLADDYEPYEPQIVPKEAGEVWENYQGKKCFIISKNGVLHRAWQDGYVNKQDNMINLFSIGGMIHGQNGWTRLRPEVPDPNIERVVIEEATFIYKNNCLVLSTKNHAISTGSPLAESLVNVEVGKLTFEWNKATP